MILLGDFSFNTLLSNWRGGLIGIAVFLLVWSVVFFVAFMAAFGNETPVARIILHVFSVFMYLANPLWGIPLAYCFGAVVVRKRGEA
jgi:hypothetical protein